MMKMKKALSIILGGALLVSSSSYIFANDGITVMNQASQETIVENDETAIQSPETPTVTIEVLDEIVDSQNNQPKIDVDEEEFEEILEEILDELEKDQDDEEEVDEEEVDEDEVEEDEDKDENLTIEKLYSKLLKFQVVYDKVPVQAKPAIEKNMKKVQLKIVEHMIKMNKDLEALIPNLNIEEVQNQIANLNKSLENSELSEEQKQEITNSIAQLEMKITHHEELVKLVDFIHENENWQKELKNKIHQEFKEEKSKVKAEEKLAKEESKQDKEELKQQIKSNKESSVKIDKVIEDSKSEIKVHNKSNDNEKNHKKSHPLKENHPGKGNGKNK